MADTRIDEDTLRLLAESLDRYRQDHYRFETRRGALDSPEGFVRRAWSDYGAFGWLALPLSSAHGGFDGDPVAVAALMRHVGAALALEPVLASALLCGRLLELAGAERTTIASIASGEAIWAFGHAEDVQSGVDAEASTRFDGTRAWGRKVVVLHADAAADLLVSARDDATGGTSLLHVPAAGAGVRLTRYRLVDGRGAATVELDGAPARVVGRPGDAAPIVERVLVEARLALCAEAHGAIEALNRQTLAYLKTRRQFGRAIGDNQALQHRMVDLYVLQEEVRAVSAAAQRALRAGRPDAPALVAGACAHVCTAARQAAHEGVQLHGGIGMTHELAVSHYFKRLMVIGRLLGDRDAHLARFAAGGPVPA
jgi:alkylation response protein AidB-like acyl-CoA dehydrogenase